MNTVDMVALEEYLGQMPSDIYEVRYDFDVLNVRVSPVSDEGVVQFRDLTGFRFLDEGDLLEFWPEDAKRLNGWIYEVKSGGWKELESNRGGFLSGERAAVREFFVATANGCLSVLSGMKPEIAK